MTRRPWIGFALSLALHAGVLAVVVVALSRDDWLPALVVDLRDDFLSGAVRAAAGGSSPGARASARAARRSWRPTRESSHGTPHPAEGASRPATGPPPTVIAETPPSELAPLPTLEPPRESPATSPAPTQEPVPSKSLAGVTAGDKPPPYSALVRGDAREGSPRSDAGSRMTGFSMSGGGGAASGSNGGSGAASGGGVGQTLALAVPGAGSGVGGEYGPYLTALRQRIQQSVRYPASARRRGISGTVNVEILILPSGMVGEVHLLESSTHPVLDDAALDTIRSLPRMPLPPDVPARPLRVRVPVVFQIQ